MKFCAIICELNPLTNGHKYLIEQAKKQTNLPILALMSGNFVQRTELSVLPKEERAKNAIEAGASFCLELPFIYAIGAAENFATGAIKCLNALNSVSFVAFGHEWPSTHDLKQIALFLAFPSKEFNAKLKAALKQGNTYHTTLENTLQKFLPQISIKEIFNGPNNILAIEYLKALYKTQSKIKPVFVLRQDNGLNSKTSVGKFLSATSIRKQVLDGNTTSIKNFVPTYSYNCLKQANKPNTAAFNLFLLHTLRSINTMVLSAFSGEELNLKKAIIKNAQSKASFEELINATLCKRYREPRIKRAILELAFNITPSLTSKIEQEPVCLKLLSCKKEFKPNIKFLRQGSAQIIVTNKDYAASTTSASLNLDLTASNTFATFAGLPYNYDLKVGTIFV